MVESSGAKTGLSLTVWVQPPAPASTCAVGSPTQSLATWWAGRDLLSFQSSSLRNVIVWLLFTPSQISVTASIWGLLSQHLRGIWHLGRMFCEPEENALCVFKELCSLLNGNVICAHCRRFQKHKHASTEREAARDDQ